jgi:hypothetical protein
MISTTVRMDRSSNPPAKARCLTSDLSSLAGEANIFTRKPWQLGEIRI